MACVLDLPLNYLSPSIGCVTPALCPGRSAASDVVLVVNQADNGKDTRHPHTPFPVVGFNTQLAQQLNLDVPPSVKTNDMLWKFGMRLVASLHFAR